MISRRDFLKTAGACAAAAMMTHPWEPGAQAAPSTLRPNILWISCEDTSPWLGYCGEPYASTPNLDRLAAEGVHYTRAFVSAPVCSPCRFGIITSTYASGMGAQRLRSEFPVPDFIKGFPSYLRQAGYYCTNNVKTDYNTGSEKRLIAESWDACSARAHWRGRKDGQPFFSIFNLTETHQSQIFAPQAPEIALEQRHDPDKAPLPPYFPDTPAARATMARVHDCISAMDRHAGAILAELDKDGLKDDTIVFFWPDHGMGIPRGKRTLWDSGLQVPLVVRFPEKYRALAPTPPGSKCDRLVSLLDLGPTLLSLAGLPAPSHMQGRPFLGAAASQPRQYVYGARDRVDEAMDLSRSVRDGRYLYIRNYMPDISWMQPEMYSDQLELRREMKRLAAAGKLNEAQLTYVGPRKPAEALYDTQADPWNLKNLAGDPAQRPILERMRKALREWLVEQRDLGFIHEWQAWRMCADGRPLWEAAREEKTYAFERVLDTAERVGKAGEAAEFIHRLADPDPTVRYWAAVGLRVAGAEALAGREPLIQALQDASISVRVEAAGVLAAQAGDRKALDVLLQVLRDPDACAAAHAGYTLRQLGEKARPGLAELQVFLKEKGFGTNPVDYNDFATNCVAQAVEMLTGAPMAATLGKARKKGRPR